MHPSALLVSAPATATQLFQELGPPAFHLKEDLRRDDGSLQELAQECTGTQGTKLFREGDGNMVGWWLSLFQIGSQPSQHPQRASQAYTQEQRGYLGYKKLC